MGGVPVVLESYDRMHSLLGHPIPFRLSALFIIYLLYILIIFCFDEVVMRSFFFLLYTVIKVQHNLEGLGK